MRPIYAALLTVFTIAHVHAQSMDVEKAETRGAPGEQSVKPAEEPKAQKPSYRGVSVGSMLIYPSIVLSSYYDDNIYATNVNQVNDIVYLLSPEVVINSNWDRNYLRVEGAADIARYNKHDTEDHEHYRGLIEGRYDIGKSSNVYGGVQYSHDVEDRESPDAVFGVTPTVYRNTNAYIGGFQQIGRFWYRVGGTYQNLNFNNVRSSLGITINNNDRDRDIYTAGTNFGYLITPNFSGLIQASVDYRQYPNGLDDFGFDRDSKGYRALVGGIYSRAGVMDVEFYLGYMLQNYDDPSFPTVKGVALSGALDLYLDPDSTFSAYVDRTISETTVFGASSYINSVVGATFTHSLTTKLSFNLRASANRIEFQGQDRVEDYVFAGATIRYMIGSYIFVQADYTHRTLDSPIPGQDFYRNQYFLRLGAYL